MKKELKDIAPADSSVLPKWVATVWAEVRSAFLVGTFAAGIIIAGLNWYRATFPEAPAATADQLTTQTKAIRNQVEATQIVVHDALQAYTDSLALVRAEVEERMAKPILQNIIDLNRQMSRLREGQQVTGEAIEAQRLNAEATTQELLERINARPPDPSEALLRDIIKRMEAQEEIMKTLDHKRISKQKF